MIENLPDYIAWVFVPTTFLTVGFFLYAARSAKAKNGFFIAVTAVLAVLLIAHAFAALNGFFLITNTLPPRFILAPAPTAILLLALILIFSASQPSVSTLRTLTLLSIIRVPVELVLLWLYQNGQVPQLMTFEGRNFDILSGITAPIVAWLAFRGGKINKPLLVIWNLVALGLLINIVTNAILSLPTPFQMQAFDQPNRGVLYFPFIWLPAIIVPVVFVSHIWSLWQIIRDK